MKPMRNIIPLVVEQKNKPVPPERQPKPSKTEPQFILKYTVGLLFVALLLVFLSYMSHQQKQNADDLMAAQLEQTQFSVTALESFEKLQEMNKTLLETTSRQEEDMRALRDDLENTLQQSKELREEMEEKLLSQETELSALRIEEQNKNKAMQALWELSLLVRQKNYTDARALIARMEAENLPAHLSLIKSAVLSLSPQEEYARIVDLLE